MARPFKPEKVTYGDWGAKKKSLWAAAAEAAGTPGWSPHKASGTAAKWHCGRQLRGRLARWGGGCERGLGRLQARHYEIGRAHV